MILEALQRRRSEEDLREAYENLQVKSEELSVQSEELRMQNVELQTQSEELHAADETLLESDKRFRTMVNAIPQLAWITDPDGHISWYNERWYSYTGTTPEQMEGGLAECSRPGSAVKSTGAVESFACYWADV
jgi:PAS domain-containing protein